MTTVFTLYILHARELKPRVLARLAAGSNPRVVARALALQHCTLYTRQVCIVLCIVYTHSYTIHISYIRVSRHRCSTRSPWPWLCTVSSRSGVPVCVVLCCTVSGLLCGSHFLRDGNMRRNIYAYTYTHIVYTHAAKTLRTHKSPRVHRVYDVRFRSTLNTTRH